MTDTIALSGNITLKRVQRRDVGMLHRMILALAEEDIPGEEVPATPELLADHLFREPQYIEAYFLCAPEPAGFMVFYENFWIYKGSRGLYLLALYVDPAHRRKGLAEAAMSYLHAELKRRDMGQIVWHLHKNNSKANNFYSKIGRIALPEYELNYIDHD